MSDGHFLVLYDEGEDELSWHIDHPDSCETAEVEWGGMFVTEHPKCPYEHEASYAGKDPFEPWPSKAGRYPIEHWVTEYRHWEYGSEWDTGVTVGLVGGTQGGR